MSSSDSVRGPRNPELTPAAVGLAAERPDEPFEFPDVRGGSAKETAIAETTIEPAGGWPKLELSELWGFRDLIYQLTLRNVRVRYKQTALGVAWSILIPVLWMAVFLLTPAGPISGGTISRSVIVFSGLVPWLFFQTAVTTAANSVVSNEGLVTKVFFPRLVIPIAAVAAALVDFALSFAVLVAMMFWQGTPFSLSILLLPLAVVILVLAATGIGALIAAWTVSLRDFRHAVVYLLPIWMLATPAVYRSPEPLISHNASQASVASAKAGAVLGDPTQGARPSYFKPEWLQKMNPMSAPIEFFRAALLGLPIAWGHVVQSAAVMTAFCLIGLFYFRRVEDSFADII